ncbi:unnamed protein product [Lactuca saligna]|uniref:Uncharacterized protein n=1 Tax=Lactuca saligna TaxID=75948 RepID=A0AA35YW17_LACSI|nr:unnamed protein product [Lactuca saligna]
MLWSTTKVDVQTQISEGDVVLSLGVDLLTKATIDLMGSQLVKLQAHFDLQHGSRKHAPYDVSLGVHQNNCGSTPILDALDVIKVMIDDIDSRYENFPPPVMTKEVSNLQGEEQRAKKQIPTTSLVPTTARAGTNKNIPNQTSNKARPIEYLHDCLKTNQVVNIVADSGILLVGT